MQLRDILLNTAPVDSLNADTVLVTLAVASVCGLVIYVLYRFFNKAVVYNANFNLLILLVCDITALIIITIGANLVLSLGLVGALSVVRFRAAVKDPLDVGFLFWGVAAGLTAGARLYLVAVLGTAFIGLVFIVVSAVRMEKRGFLLIIRYAAGGETQVAALMKDIKYKLKNKTYTADWIELTAEVKVKKNEVGFITPLSASPEVISATLTEYNGIYT